MRVAIVGAGPAGLFLSFAFARRGHQVVLVERDPGPGADAVWRRRGVMQFHHPHALRHQVRRAVLDEMPDVWADVLAAGAEVVAIPGAPEDVCAVRCRRETFERVLRSAAEAEPGVAVVVGHADRLATERGRAAGVVVGGGTLTADLVVDASGRSGRWVRDLRGPAEGGDCGMAYVSQLHRLSPGASPGPLNAPIGLFSEYAGYRAIVFPHDNRTFSTLLIRAAADAELGRSRDPEAFRAVLRVVPGFADWTADGRSHPISPVMPGGHLLNSYRGQLDADGRVPVPGLVFVGDAVCTTNPALGRGIALSLLQARRLLAAVDDGRDLDPEAWAVELDAWCRIHIHPWFVDHVHSDGVRVAMWAGENLDPARRLPSEIVVAATQDDPALMPLVGPYLSMLAPPSSLDPLQPVAQRRIAGGWRPPVAIGPSRDELAELVASRTAGTVAA
jgi:2-polyprenyl-6-methoxyphenol hydroxylase-like FAD-dependent oxidoreductase